MESLKTGIGGWEREKGEWKGVGGEGVKEPCPAYGSPFNIREKNGFVFSPICQ